MNLKYNLALNILGIQLHLISTVFGTCPEPWVAVGKKCVHMSTEPMTWWESSDYCSSLTTDQGNGMLASTPDCLDFAELTYYVGYAAMGQGSFWIGAHTEFTSHNWKWLTLEPLTTGVPFWAYSEGHGQNEECAAMESEHYYQLADDDCEALKGAVCMVDQDSTEFKRFERSHELLDCPDETMQVGDHCYHFSKSHDYWNMAEKRCQDPASWTHQNPGELFSPSSCEEFSHMAHHLETEGNTKYWVGAVDVTGYNEWSWVSGDLIPSGAPYWASGQPSSSGSGHARSHCAYMDPDKRRYLNDDTCTNRHNYICEVFIQ